MSSMLPSMSKPVSVRVLDWVRRPWLLAVARVRARRIVADISPDKVRLQVVQGRKAVQILGQWEARVPLAQDVVSASCETLGQLLLQLPPAWRVAPCTVVLADQWIRWSSIPWLGSRVSLTERQALLSARISALYADTHGWLLAHGQARFGDGQLVATVSPSWQAGLTRALKARGSVLGSFVSTHALAVDRFTQVLNRAKAPPTDLLFATLQAGTLTLSWSRHETPSLESRNSTLLSTSQGIRSLQCESDLEQALRYTRREILLQRLVDPQVCLMVFGLEGQAANGLRDAQSDQAGIFVLSGDGPWDLRSATRKLVDSASFKARPSGCARRRMDIAIDFAMANRTTPMWYRGLLLAGIALLVGAGATYAHLAQQLSELQTRLEQDAQKASQPRAPVVLSDTQKAQAVYLQRIQTALDRPWENLFHCIESSTNPDITLSAIAPDIATGELHLSGDARSFKSITRFVDALEAPVPTSPSAQAAEPPTATPPVPTECAKLRDPYLSSYQVNEQDPQRTVHFEINAKWDANSQKTAPRNVASGSPVP